MRQNQTRSIFIGLIILMIISIAFFDLTVGMRLLIAAVIFISFHYAIYKIDAARPPHQKWRIFLPAIVMSIPTAFFLGIFIINQISYANSAPGNGGFNEDVSMIFLIISASVTLASFLVSLGYWKILKQRGEALK